MAGVVMPGRAFWEGKRVFLTGHTGFKGAWLWLWLTRLGAIPTGFALPPEGERNLASVGGIADEPSSHFGDIRDSAALDRCMADAEPEIVMHLAAQALVRRSYREPVDTMTTNVVGTANVLEAVRRTPSVKAVVSVTSDKCYLNREWVWPYRENEPLGAGDPYSASKACAELVTTAWRHSFLAEAGVAVATARAGNVIGGGDWSEDRLVPDCIAAMSRGDPVVIRNPLSTRPWQHVLEPLAGYLILAERLYGSGQEAAEAWNFGPDLADVQPVSVVADRLVALWGEGAHWSCMDDGGPTEAGLLAVDASKAKSRLGWRPRLALSEALAWTVAWHRGHFAGRAPRDLTDEQIRLYESRA
jgi:CDP-glucose 4,6-dehydratase